MKTLQIDHHRWIFFVFLVSLLALYKWWVYSPFDTYSRWIERNRQSVGALKKDHFSFAVFGDNKNSKFVFEKLLKTINTDVMYGGELVFLDTCFYLNWFWCLDL